ncbi:MAG: DnaJ domain-containing protein [Porphyromonadaceae bacterium]|nr:DnaJ domain-containing protein [Porphyromonadaceae bacterium]
MIKDYYKILNLDITSTQEEIKYSFRKLAIFWHPDKNSNPIALHKMQEINEAYEILSNPQRRKTYDNIYKEYLKLKLNIEIYRYTTEDYRFTKDKESNFNHNQEENFRKKYKNEIDELNNWIKGIKFSLASINSLLDKSLAKIDKPIEDFLYYFPIILLLIILIIILFSINLS